MFFIYLLHKSYVYYVKESGGNKIILNVDVFLSTLLLCFL